MINDDFLCLQEEINQATRATLGPPAERTRLGSPEEKLVICRHCGAMVRLIGVPPEGPEMALYYPMQYCPQCGAEVGRGSEISLISRAPWIPVYAPVIGTIACRKCGSELKVATPHYIFEPAVAPIPETKYCPICSEPIPLATTVGSTVEVISAMPWPPVAEKPEELPTAPITGVLDWVKANWVCATLGIIGVGAVAAGMAHALKTKQTEDLR